MKSHKTKYKKIPYWTVPFSGIIVVIFVVGVGIYGILSWWKSGVTILKSPLGFKSRFEAPVAKSEGFQLLPKLSPTPVFSAQPLIGYCLKVPIILYHHVEPLALATKEHRAPLTVDSKYFEQHISYIVASGYTTISIDQLANALINHQKLPAKTIGITLDDGYQDAYSYAYPIAKKYNVILNLMIPSGLIGNPGFLTWDQLREMVNSGLVFAYDHTWSHYSLGAAPKLKAEMEILTAKKQLVDQLGRSVDIFAYPYGSRSNLVTDILRSNGFVAALSTIPGFYQCDSFIYSLHRNHIGGAPLSSYGL